MSGVLTRGPGGWTGGGGTPDPFSPIYVPAEDGVLWGATANAFSLRDAPWPAQGPEAHRYMEADTGRTIGVYAAYHKNAVTFPGAPVIGLTTEAGKERVLHLHWRITYDEGGTWADIVNGVYDTRIDAEIAYLQANFATDKFFLSLYPEPESYVVDTPGSGQEATDFAAMYRYVHDRFVNAGIDNAIWVVTYMGYSSWATESWFSDLYPGDAYVDWVAWDPYSNTGGTYMDFSALMNSTYGSTDPEYQGFYNTQTALHAKPMMLSEFGIAHKEGQAPEWDTAKAAAFWTSMASQLWDFPRVKAAFVFDAASDPYGGLGTILYDLTPESKAAFITLSGDARLVNPTPQEV